MDWNALEYTMRFFGLETEEELEDFCAEHDVPVKLWPDGSIESVGRQGVEGWKEPLFKHHGKKVGHRPDDEKEMDKQQKLLDKAEADEAKLVNEHKVKLKDRVDKRKGKAAKSGRTAAARSSRS